MVSFDVKSLYLSLPHPLIISELKKLLYNTPIDTHTADYIVNLTSLCLNMNIFTFNQQYYKQIRGSPMGSPLSSMLQKLPLHRIKFVYVYLSSRQVVEILGTEALTDALMEEVFANKVWSNLLVSLSLQRKWIDERNQLELTPVLVSAAFNKEPNCREWRIVVNV
ncbi:hypothetical protein LAZ67_17001304 [Cordylochernes scorpioides]|uniref:Reverse transcriptase domain-containing protein n=1 Tax=Cordylochernes scorpioides TaxID=51811 RepID=A0ABY6LFF2_9ARAC|nr:hypothetical protein LAZ67_17001304 [Cordylochernes scorpioides]